MAWANETDPDSFFTSNKVKDLYKANIKAITTHVNSKTQVAYKDDPTILAWGEHKHLFLIKMDCCRD